MFTLMRHKNQKPLFDLFDFTKRDYDIFDEMFKKFYYPDESKNIEKTNSKSFYPSLDIIEKKDRYEINADLPGLTEKDIDISLIEKDNILVIKGEKTRDKKEEGDNYYTKERSYGCFKREIQLPDNINQNIQASYSNGVLKLILHKKEEEQKKQNVKKIEIKSI